jgi:hypothetical protein
VLPCWSRRTRRPACSLREWPLMRSPRSRAGRTGRLLSLRSTCKAGSFSTGSQRCITRPTVNGPSSYTSSVRARQHRLSGARPTTSSARRAADDRQLARLLVRINGAAATRTRVTIVPREDTSRTSRCRRTGTPQARCSGAREMGRYARRLILDPGPGTGFRFTMRSVAPRRTDSGADCPGAVTFGSCWRRRRGP